MFFKPASGLSDPVSQPQHAEAAAFPKRLAGALCTPDRRKTLILCPIGLGNFLMATPGLKRLSEVLGPDNLHLLALKDSIRNLGEATEYFGQVHCWDPDKETKRAGLRLGQALRREHFDYSLSLFPTGNWRFSLFAAWIGAQTKIGFAYPNERLPAWGQTLSAPLNMTAHDTDQNYDLIRTLVGSDEDRPRELLFPFPPRPLGSDTRKQEPYFVCHPGSSEARGMKEKRLPPDAFAQLSRHIYREFGLRCLLIGGPEEVDIRQSIIKLAPESTAEARSDGFAGLATLIAGARFYLGNDSGLMHVSVALQKRCIVFFGPTDERRTGPYADGLRRGISPHLIVRRDDLRCAPCWTIHSLGKNPPCIYGDTRCLQQLELKEAWGKIRQFIRTTGLA